MITRAQHGSKITSSGLSDIKGTTGEEEEVGRQADGDQEEGDARGWSGFEVLPPPISQLLAVT
jgi:hypothetical protein